jgi:hypothetical protein
MVLTVIGVHSVRSDVEGYPSNILLAIVKSVEVAKLLIAKEMTRKDSISAYCIENNLLSVPKDNSVNKNNNYTYIGNLVDYYIKFGNDTLPPFYFCGFVVEQVPVLDIDDLNRQ